jgi:hypothetical protein
MRSLSLLFALAVVSCASREIPPPTDSTPLDQRLAQFATLQNSGQYDALRSHFTKDAVIQSPITPQSADVDGYLRALAAEPYSVSFSDTEVVYAFPGRAMTRSQVKASAPGRFNLTERVTVDWRLEDEYWRIARIKYAGWPAIIGTWKRAGLRNEGSIELRVLPGDRYVVYVAEDHSEPAFQGHYRLEGNKIHLADSSAWNAKTFQRGEGSYLFVRTPTGMSFQKVNEANTWRAERFEGAWTLISN